MVKKLSAQDHLFVLTGAGISGSVFPTVVIAGCAVQDASVPDEETTGSAEEAVSCHAAGKSSITRSEILTRAREMGIGVTPKS